MTTEIDLAAERTASLPLSPEGAGQPLAPSGIADPVLALIERAARDPAVDIAKMQALFELRERLEDRRAKAAFDNAIAHAKGEIGPIVKNRLVDFTNKTGQRTNYRYEDFAGVASAVDPVLARHGLSYRFRSDQTGNKLRVTCRISHADGFGEDTTLEAANDESGNKNSIQSVGSACTYLQRYTLKLALGLAASNDDDGRLGKDEGSPEIDADQRAYLEQQLRDTASDVPKFLQVLGAASFDALTVAQYQRGLALLEQKKRRAVKP
jgi:ERF superfamily